MWTLLYDRYCIVFTPLLLFKKCLLKQKKQYCGVTKGTDTQIHLLQVLALRQHLICPSSGYCGRCKSRQSAVGDITKGTNTACRLWPDSENITRYRPPPHHWLQPAAANRGLSALFSGGLPSLLRPTSGPSHILRPGWLVVQSCAGRLPKAPWGVAVSPVLAYRPVAIKRVSAHHGDPHVSWM